MSTMCPACTIPSFTTEFIKKFTNDEIINIDFKNKNCKMSINNINTHINECCAQSFLNVTNKNNNDIIAMLLRDIELINNNFVNLSNKFLEIVKTTQSSNLFTPNKMGLNSKLNTEYIHKTPKYLNYETETVSQKISSFEKQILDLNEHNHYLSKQTQELMKQTQELMKQTQELMKQTQELMKQKEDFKQKLIVSDYEHKLQLKDLINSCVSGRIETKTCCKKTHNNTLNKNNTINNNGTLNIININQYISEFCSGASNINKVK